MAMLTSSGSADYGLFDELAEEFAERYHRGERPSLQEYVDRCPEMADEIRELFPALVEVEQAEEVLEPQREAAASPAAPVLRQVVDYRVIREVGRGGMGVVYGGHLGAARFCPSKRFLTIPLPGMSMIG